MKITTALRAPLPILAFALAAALSRGDDPAMRVLAGGPDAPDAGRTVERRGGNPSMAAVETESAAFLGVETAPITDTLTDQLNLPQGIGLVVLHTSTDSPAAEVLKAHDILLKLDDQQLVDTRQLAVLIRNHKEGDEVTLTFLRGGKEATAKAKLVLRHLPKLPPISFEGPGPGHEFGPEKVQGMLSLMGPRQAEAKRAGTEGEPEIREFKIDTGDSHVTYSDDLGTLDLTVADGRQTLVAKNAKGDQLFSGRVDTPDERKALPKEVRERFDRLESQINVDQIYRLDSSFKGTDSKGAPPSPPVQPASRPARRLPLSPAAPPSCRDRPQTAGGPEGAGRLTKAETTRATRNPTMKR